jgi:hypothetical protein
MPTSQFHKVQYYYTFEYYLYEQELDYTVLDYLNNNNIKIDKLICFFDIIKNGVYYIITTDKKNLHQVIAIAKCNNSENSIYSNFNLVTILYNGCTFNIYNSMSLQDAENIIGITGKDIINYSQLNNKIIYGNEIYAFRQFRNFIKQYYRKNQLFFT